ncbi:hypothetical protein [Rhodopseudomonas palustris]|jgi:hypothetical protein|uniref:hypothetical protein n=1 Tax=Rhodopseudomonas palustris TaxID=1076 RepID=UPI0021F3579A|nr:hypothetical protein [Rhodopseudomonas palustris]UYO52365.1 hypothetical protein KQX61_17370 [Rhodopseudomonas palustris]
MTEDFEYDVAFSFNALDESIATQLNDLLSPRVKTFIYSERQREIAGTDGQEKFSEVYGQTARLVVVLFRPEWGETPWTRVERDAIKNRSLNDGWDFTVFVPTVERPQMPPWLPKTKLYVGLHRWGIEATAAVIEARVSELGGNPHEETVVERADRFARAVKFNEQQERFQSSHEGVQAALQAYDDFSTAMERQVEAIASAGIKINVKRSQHFRILTGLSPCNTVCSFLPFYANVIKDIHLSVDVYKGFPELPGFIPPWEKPKKLKSLRYHYNLVRPDYHAWVGIDEKGREFAPQQLADHVLRTYMDITEHTKPG